MRIKDGQQLKDLQVKAEKLRTNLDINNQEQQELIDKYAELANKLTSVEHKIRAIQGDNIAPIISEHALLRYIERVKGFNLEDLKNEILTEGTIATIKACPNVNINMADGHEMIVKNKTVISIT